MNILIVAPGGLDPEGGKLIPVLPPILAQLSKDNNLRIALTRQDTSYREYEIDGIPVVSVPTSRLHRILSQYHQIKRYCEKSQFRPDLIHCFWLGVPTLLARLLAGAYKAPLFATIWGGELVHVPAIAYGGLSGWRGRMLQSASGKMAQTYSVGSHYLKARIPSGLARDAQVIPLGIDPDFWRPAEHSPGGNCCNILHLASISPVKNPQLLVELAQCLIQRNLHFTITSIGLDTMHGSIQALANSAGVAGKIEFRGPLTPGEVKKAMCGKHFILQTSHFESQGVGMMEGVSQGLCPVGTRVGWLHDAGIGIDPSSGNLAHGIADDIEYLWSAQTLRLERLHSARKALHNICSTQTAKQFQQVYAELLSGART